AFEAFDLERLRVDAIDAAAPRACPYRTVGALAQDVDLAGQQRILVFGTGGKIGEIRTVVDAQPAHVADPDPAVAADENRFEQLLGDRPATRVVHDIAAGGIEPVDAAFLAHRPDVVVRIEREILDAVGRE